MVLALTGAMLLGSAVSCSSASAASRSDEQPDTELQLGQEEIFAAFDPDPTSATPMRLPTETAETFLK